MSVNISANLSNICYVAYLDVLGFKELVFSQNHEKLDTYFNTIQEALEAIASDKAQVMARLISDSTILACNHSHEDLRLLLRAIQTIQYRCALENIWIRGAVSIGSIHFGEKIVVGQGLINAYLLEQEAKFARVIIDPKIISEFGERRAFFQTYNNTEPGSSRNGIPLIHEYHDNHIEDDAIFVAYGEKIASQSLKNIEGLYENVRHELYKEHRNYSKYMWLKRYFAESILSYTSTAFSVYPFPTRSTQETSLRNWSNRFLSM